MRPLNYCDVHSHGTKLFPWPVLVIITDMMHSHLNVSQTSLITRPCRSSGKNWSSGGSSSLFTHRNHQILPVKTQDRITPTFLQVFVSLIHINAPLLTFPLHWQVMAELALVTFRTLTLLEERTQHRLRINACSEDRGVSYPLTTPLDTHDCQEWSNKNGSSLPNVNNSMLITRAAIDNIHMNIYN